jgi:hypothetical protein
VCLIARQTQRPAAWSSASNNVASIFQIGQWMLHKLPLTPQSAFQAVVDLSVAWDGNWGCVSQPAVPAFESIRTSTSTRTAAADHPTCRCTRAT